LDNKIQSFFYQSNGDFKMSKQQNNAPKGKPMTPTDAARIQSSTAKQNGGQVPSGSFASTAQRAAQNNQNNK
jgi:hypothetical protein